MQVLVFVDRSVTEDLLVRMLAPQDLLILMAKSPDLGCEVCMFLTGGKCQHVDIAIAVILSCKERGMFLLSFTQNRDFAARN